MSAISRESQIRTTRQEFLDRNGLAGAANSTQPFDLLLTNLATPAAESASADVASRRDRLSKSASGPKSEAPRGTAKSPAAESRQTGPAEATPRSTSRETPAANRGTRETASASKETHTVGRPGAAPTSPDGVSKGNPETEETTEDLWLDPSQILAYAHALPSLSLPTELPAVEGISAEPVISAIDSNVAAEIPSPEVELEPVNEFELTTTLEAALPASADEAPLVDLESVLPISQPLEVVEDSELEAIDRLDNESLIDPLPQEVRELETTVTIEPNTVSLTLDPRAGLNVQQQSPTAPLDSQEQTAEIAAASIEQKPKDFAPALPSISKGEKAAESNSTSSKSKATSRSESVSESLPATLPLVETLATEGVELSSSETQSPTQELPSVQGNPVTGVEVDGARDANRVTISPTLNLNASAAPLNSQIDPRDSSRMEHADSTRRAVGLTAAEYRRFQHRVEKAFELANQRDGEIRLRLSPPRLGSLRVELKLEGETMTARVETETEGARQLIMDSLPALRDRLAEQGIRIQSFEVDLYTDQRSAQEQSFDQSQQRDRQRPSTRDETNDERKPSLAERRMLGGSGLDVMI